MEEDISWCIHSQTPICVFNFKAGHHNPFKDQTSTDFIYRYLIFRWVAETWQQNRVPGYYPSNSHWVTCPHSYIYSALLWIITDSSQCIANKGIFYLYGLTLTPAWICNHMPNKMWHEITYPFPNFNGTFQICICKYYWKKTAISLRCHCVKPPESQPRLHGRVAVGTPILEVTCLGRPRKCSIWHLGVNYTAWDHTS